MTAQSKSPAPSAKRRSALRFVLLVGTLSFFADFTYEGARGVIGPYLALLGASATIVGIVTGFGELLGYGLRLFSGRLADVTRQFWPITITGYVLQMSVVPLLAFTTSWPAAAALVMLERVGKAIRNPPRDVMLSYAAHEAGGYGWAFGVHEAMDQFGAMFGPLLVAAVLAHSGSYAYAFGVLVIPAAFNIIVVLVAHRLFPDPRALDTHVEDTVTARGLPRCFWVYLVGACMIAAGFADYPLIAYHFNKSQTVPGVWISVFYAVAMGVSGSGSLLFGRLFDRFGFSILIGLTLVSAAFAPLVFLGGFRTALAGAMLWGLGAGVHESIIPAAVSPMVPGERRAWAFGLFTACYGLFWFLGSAVIGILYDHSTAAAIVFCVVTQLLALLPFLWVARTSHRKPTRM